MNGLMIHVDCKDVKREELKLIPTPEPRSRIHKPIPHFFLDETFRNVLSLYDFQVDKAGYGISPLEGVKVPGSKLFFTYNLSHPEIDTSHGRGLMIGGRAGNGGELGLKVYGGHNVFVCDNMCLSGEEMLFYTKHTKGVQLLPLVETGVARLLEVWGRSEEVTGRLYEKLLTPQESKAIFWDLFEAGVMTPAMTKRAAHSYWEADLEELIDHQGSMGDVREACTRQLRELPVRQKVQKTDKLAKFMLGALN